jgi:selenocysteine lyase/cysteine desulfurase
MALDRRELVVRGLTGAVAVGVAGCNSAPTAEPAAASTGWTGIRRQFRLAADGINMATFLLASHPLPVRRAVERHRAGLDANAEHYLARNQVELERRVAHEAAGYLGTRAGSIAFTDSTTMGLGLVYGSVVLEPGDEIVTTEHDFYSTHESLRLRAARTGCHVRRIRLYADPRAATADEIVTSVERSLTANTRLLAITWVHSSTGVKLPVTEIARVVGRANDGREPRERILLCVDGVHGFGNQREPVARLGCDVFVSGTHKWLFGPRGTGLVWANDDAWSKLRPIIPSFDLREIVGWLSGNATQLPPAAAMTPGGFHTFEHRWALADAFAWQRQIGRSRVAARTAHLAQRLKQGLSQIRRVQLRTPIDPALSAGLVCIELDGVPPREAVARLARRHAITASVTPYAVQYLRFGPSIANSEAEVERVVRAVSSLR